MWVEEAFRLFLITNPKSVESRSVHQYQAWSGLALVQWTCGKRGRKEIILAYRCTDTPNLRRMEKHTHTSGHSLCYFFHWVSLLFISFSHVMFLMSFLIKPQSWTKLNCKPVQICQLCDIFSSILSYTSDPWETDCRLVGGRNINRVYKISQFYWEIKFWL